MNRHSPVIRADVRVEVGVRVKSRVVVRVR